MLALLVLLAGAAGLPGQAVERQHVLTIRLPTSTTTCRGAMADQGPKSAYELAMERLKKQDAEAGVVEHKLTDAQKAAIAEARSLYEARVAELQILHRDKQLTTVDPQAYEKMEEEYRRDLERLANDRDAKIRRIREETPSQ
jgi:hypothetical protein